MSSTTQTGAWPSIGTRLSNSALSTALRSKTEGGIRYSGKFPRLQMVGLVISKSNAVYQDALIGDHLAYVGEGRKGHQKLARGNRALAWCYFSQEPVRLFVQHGTNQWEYRGQFDVVGITTRIEPDEDSAVRAVLVFEMRKTAAVGQSQPVKASALGKLMARDRAGAAGHNP